MRKMFHQRHAGGLPLAATHSWGAGHSLEDVLHVLSATEVCQKGRACMDTYSSCCPSSVVVRSLCHILASLKTILSGCVVGSMSLRLPRSMLPLSAYGLSRICNIVFPLCSHSCVQYHQPPSPVSCSGFLRLYLIQHNYGLPMQSMQ